MNQHPWKNDLAQDLAAMGLAPEWKWRYVVTNRIAWFVRTLRICEYKRARTNLWSRLTYLISRLYFERLSEQLGFDIPLGVFQAGLSIAHRGTIVVNGDARVGQNCRIHPGVTIGASNSGSPIIGDDVFIGPGVGVFGGIHVGEKSVLGPHSLINTDLKPNTLTFSSRAVERTYEGLPWSSPGSRLGPQSDQAKTSYV